jgi:hypothetical protein
VAGRDGFDVDPGAAEEEEDDDEEEEEDDELAIPAIVAGALVPAGVMVPPAWRGLAPAPPNWLRTAVANMATAPMATTTWAGLDRRTR